MINTKGGIMKGRQNRQAREKGAVSLFVVMFTAMLFVAVTVGFTVLMLTDEQQASDNDLAQSALDSANAGAEDAKRVLAQYTDCIERGMDMSVGDCNMIQTAVQAQECNTIGRAAGDSSSDERMVETTVGRDEALQQAYTCVKITPNTESYVGTTRSEGDIRLIPLKTDGVSVTKVTIEWLAPADLTNVSPPTDAELESEPQSDVPVGQVPKTIKLPKRDEWITAKQGSILRVGSIQYQPGDINLTEIDDQSRAVFLYPDEVVSGVTLPDVDLNMVDMHRPLTSASDDLGAATPSSPQPSSCRLDGSYGEYLCKTTITLPVAADPATTLRYITVASLYRNTSFQVKMYDGDAIPANLVLFRNVQPEIDVTGRANDVFRRTVSRVESADASEAPYPRAALGSMGDICKNYLITDDPDDYHYYPGIVECSTPSGWITNPDSAP